MTEPGDDSVPSLPERARVVNVGLSLFADAVARQGFEVVDVDWRIPAGGDAEVVAALARLYGPKAGVIDAANAEVLRRLDGGAPRAVGVRAAADVVPGFGATTLLHCGPPVDYADAREFGCLVAGVDYGTGAIVDAQRAADAAGLCDRVGFMQGEAGALPFADGVFDAVLCECSLSTFENKPRAVAEMRRVLRPGGRVAISDVVADPGRLPETLRGRVATLGCIGGAMPLSDYQRLLAEHGLRTYAIEPLDAEAGRLAGRLEDRLRFGRIMDRCRANRELCPFGFDEAIAAVRLARRAIDERLLGYAIITAVR